MSGKLRARLTLVAGVAVLLSAGALAARTRTLSNFVDLGMAVASPYIPVMTLSGLVLLVLCRRILLSIVAAIVMVAVLSVQVRWYYLERPADIGRHVDVRVLSLNLHRGQAEAPSLVGLADASADVITVSELTPEEAQRLSQADIDGEFPYSMLAARPGADGIGLWSRFPLEATPPPQHDAISIVGARLRVPGLRFEPLVASLHIISPATADVRAFGLWRKGITTTRTDLNNFAQFAASGAVIVAGDFNSTPDMRQFRDLLTNGYRDAVEQTGAGFAPTFPSGSWYPPLIVIDHVLTHQSAAASIRTVYVRGSDHRALLATIRVPSDPSGS